MQISRHWRLNAQRYRLEGYRYEDGTVSLQDRHGIVNEDVEDNETQEQHPEPVAVSVA